MQITIATGNRGKIAEIAAALSTSGAVQLTSILDIDPDFNPAETGSTLRENAAIKALAAARLAGGYALADDTGLYVDALRGEPGIRAARYAGEHCSFADNIAKMLKELSDVPAADRSARFVTVLALSHPTEPTRFFEGECRGTITTQPRGEKGFGYDPIFFVPAVNKTFAEMTTAEKQQVSHRGAAVRAFAQWLRQR